MKTALGLITMGGAGGLWAAEGAATPVTHTVPPAAAPVAATRSYCNPLTLPNYPVGRRVRDIEKGAPPTSDRGWLVDRMEQFRELADPSALWHEGKWYLYPSCDMAWVSADEGLTWQHHPLNIRDVGYAPTVVKHQGRFLLMASDSAVYTSESPLGPFEKLGPIQLPPTPGMPGQTDPMLFSDEDGRLYFYWGCTPRSGIWGAELDANNPTRVISTPTRLIAFRPDLHPWEGVGSSNQNPHTGWLEGAWMVKVRGKYYLTYAAGGTQYRSYAMGCYSGSGPLGPFAPQKRNPILRTTEGLVTGTAHGAIVAGPRDQLWVFYTLYACVAYGFERRVGMDRAAIDADGEIYVPAATSSPQFLAPVQGSGEAARPGAWLPLNQYERTQVSSQAPNLPGRLAVDNNMTTWWQPAEGEETPVVTSSLCERATIHAVRLIWRDIGLDTPKGVRPGPIRYRVEVESAPNVWRTLIDRSTSQEDLLIDYRECEPAAAERVRLVIVGTPKGITPGLVEFTVFGLPVDRH